MQSNNIKEPYESLTNTFVSDDKFYKINNENSIY